MLACLRPYSAEQSPLPSCLRRDTNAPVGGFPAKHQVHVIGQDACRSAPLLSACDARLHAGEPFVSGANRVVICFEGILQWGVAMGRYVMCFEGLLPIESLFVSLQATVRATPIVEFRGKSTPCRVSGCI